MKYGVCGGFEIGRIAAQSGFDYFEMTVGGLLKPLEEEAAFVSNLKLLENISIPCQVVNVFVPAQIKITGPQVDHEILKKYVTTTCQRAKIAGIKVIVFGSGGARQIPEGFPRLAAWRQLGEFCKMLAPIAEENGITIAIEPLNQSECNVINSVREGANLVNQVQHPSIRLLVDAYHWAKENENPDDLIANGAALAHVHIATVPNRLAPGQETCDFSPFFEALKQAKYNARISIESRLDNPQVELPVALEFLKKYQG